MWDIVWVSPQGRRSVSVSRHFINFIHVKPYYTIKSIKIMMNVETLLLQAGSLMIHHGGRRRLIHFCYVNSQLVNRWRCCLLPWKPAIHSSLLLQPATRSDECFFYQVCISKNKLINSFFPSNVPVLGLC